MSTARRRNSTDAPAGSGSARASSGGNAAGPPGGSPGWRYTLRVPSWSQAQLPDGETAVFYQVEVTVLPPQGESRKRSVGRRFSSFITLHRRLREELGVAAMRGLDPPPRRSLAGVNRKPELVEQRRWELEQWLWRLTESPQIANSVMMFHFCELDAAARMRPRVAQPPRTSPPPPAGASTATSQLDSPSGSLSTAAGFVGAGGSSTHLSPMPSYAPSWSGSEASDMLGESSTSSSLAAAAAAATAAISGSTGASPPSRQHRQRQASTPPGQPQQAASQQALGEDQYDGSSRQYSTQLPGSNNSNTLAGTGQLRLALPVQQRGAAKAAARQLRQQLATAQADLQDAARTIASDQQAIAQLAAEVQHLQEMQRLAEEVQQEDGGGSGSSGVGAAANAHHSAALAALKQRLAAVEAERDALLEQQQEQQQQERQQPAENAEEREQQVQQQMVHLQAERDELQWQAEEARRQLAAAHAELASAQQAQQEAAQGQDEERRQLLGVLESQCTSLQAQLKEAQAVAAAAAADKEAAAAKSREDLKVLAKEVKSLRKQLAAMQEQQQAASQSALEAEARPQLASQLVVQQQEQQQQFEEEREQHRQLLQARDAEIASLREQLAVAQAATAAAQGEAQAAAAAAAAQSEPTNGNVPNSPVHVAAEEQQQQQQQIEALLGAAGALRKLLGSCGVNGSEADRASDAADVLSRLTAANHQLAAIRQQVQQELLEGPAATPTALGPQANGSTESTGGTTGITTGLPLAGGERERQLRELLAGLLLDAATAKQQQHDLLRSTLAVTAQGLEERLLSPTASPVRRITTL